MGSHGPVVRGTCDAVKDCGSEDQGQGPRPYRKENTHMLHMRNSIGAVWDSQGHDQSISMRQDHEFYLPLRLPSLSYNSIQARDVQ
jgi:hypothetical protein